MVERLAKDLDAGIDTLRRAGHNIIFANISLKTLREVPEAATPERVAGLRKMVRSFGTKKGGDPGLRIGTRSWTSATRRSSFTSSSRST